MNGDNVDSSNGQQLVDELLANPARFEQIGKAYDLLQEYFEGFPINTLRPLLGHVHSKVRRAAIWICSELGEEASPLLQDALPLLHETERYLRYYALEVVAVCSVGENIDKIIRVVEALESDDETIGRHAMFLLKNVSISQLKAAGENCGNLSSSAELHRIGISLLSDGSETDAVASMLEHESSLLRRYGAIAAARMLAKEPWLIADAQASADADVRAFAESILKIQRPRGLDDPVE